MIYERAKKSDLPALTSLWHVCFGDGEAEIRGFWTAAFDKIQVYQAREGKQLAAMLCVLPTQLVDECGDAHSCGYFYAVCTAPVFRGKGICNALMQYAEKNCGYAYASLVPASEKLFDFYKKQGYRTVFYQKKYSVSAEKGAKISSATPEVYRSIRELRLYENFISYDEFLLPLAGKLYRIETEDGIFCACAVKQGKDVCLKELLPDSPKAAAALAAHLGCQTAHVQTEGDEQPFGMCKPLKRGELPAQAYLALAFD